MAKTSQNRARSKAKSQAVRGRKKGTKAGAGATKTAQITGLLQRTVGVSLDEMVKATGWQQHSLRGFLSGTIGKKKGLKLTSEKTDGERRYRIVGAGATS